MHYEYKFETKPGRYVYSPSPTARRIGKDLLSILRDRWAPPDYMYHFRRGGHVAAAAAHSKSTWLCHLDIENFFGTIGRARVAKALKRLHIDYTRANGYATHSTVVEGDRRILPYGFIQSMDLASIIVDQSELGKALRSLAAESSCSMYVDDVIISSSISRADLERRQSRLIEAARISGFSLRTKSEDPEFLKIEPFGICVRKGRMYMPKRELSRHFANIAAATEIGNLSTARGIEGYVKSVNARQAALLQSRS